MNRVRDAASQARTATGAAAHSLAGLGDQIRAHVQQLLSDAFEPTRRPAPVTLGTPGSNGTMIDLDNQGRHPEIPGTDVRLPEQPGTSAAPAAPPPQEQPTLPASTSNAIDDPDAGSIIDAPVQSTPGSRSANDYNAVIDQFDVENNPRYTPRDGNTYCNIFASDVMRAMNAPLPHYVNADGSPASRDSYDHELDANLTNAWLHDDGAAYGWRQVSPEEAQKMANEGHPAVASWFNPAPGGIGHVMVVRPGDDPSDPAIAQAGAENLDHAHVSDIFAPGANVEYWVHD